MFSLRRILVLAAVLVLASPAHAEEPVPAPSFGDRFFRGTTPGELPAPKVLVVGGLYAAGLASVVIGTATLFRAEAKGDEADERKQALPPGFCVDLASPQCAGYRRLLSDERELRSTGILLLGAGGVAALGGALTAELWPNDATAPRVSVGIEPGALLLGASARF